MLTESSDSLPLLITGITGVAGYNALRYFQRRYPGQVFGVGPNSSFHQFSFPNWSLGTRTDETPIVGLNADDADGMRRLFQKYRFGSVLNCVGNCALKSCELDRVMARQLNVASAAVVAENVRAHGCRLVHLSTDLVFSGTRCGHHVESDAVDPVTMYGKTMVAGERLITAVCPDAAILRISLPMGPSLNRHAGAIDWIDSRFRNHRPATLYFDEVRSCTFCEDLNCVFERFLIGEENGIYHLGGPRPMTLYQIAQVVNRVGGYNPELLKGCPRIMAGPVPPRAGNVSMCSDKLCTLLGYNPFRAWPADEDLFPAHSKWHHERKPGEGSFRDIVQKLYRHTDDLEFCTRHDNLTERCCVRRVNNYAKSRL